MAGVARDEGVKKVVSVHFWCVGAARCEGECGCVGISIRDFKVYLSFIELRYRR